MGLLQDAMRGRGWEPPVLIPWLNLAERLDEFAELLAGDGLLRLESPGQDFEVEKYLLTLGADEPEDRDQQCDRLEREQIARLEFERGRIRCPRQWYRGFRSLLLRLTRVAVARPHIRWLNPPEDVGLMFEKRDCQERFREAGISVPRSLPGMARFDSLLVAMRNSGIRRVFVKLACGSSASGVIALATQGSRMVAHTTVQRVTSEGRSCYFNSRKLRRYDRTDDIADIINMVCREGAQVEAWIPKAMVGQQSCDLRALMIGGTPSHIVLRRSHTPVTNLHLLNQRGDADSFLGSLDTEVREAALEDCRRAAALFPGSLHVGIDLAFDRSLRRHFILEANAFGDLLGGITSNGLTTHEAEIAALEAMAS